MIQVKALVTRKPYPRSIPGAPPQITARWTWLALPALLLLLFAGGSMGAEQAPADAYQQAFDARDKRITISAVFVSILVGLAYAEMFGKIRDALRRHGVHFEDLMIFIAFFLTGMRFFIGNQIYLLGLSDPAFVSDMDPTTLVHQSGKVWIYDFLWISGQGVVLAFLGSVSSRDASRRAKVDFYHFLILLYGVDIAWIGSQYILWKSLVPWSLLASPPAWQWAVLNAAFILVLVAMLRFSADRYGRAPLALLALFSVVAFAIDIFLIDNAGLL